MSTGRLGAGDTAIQPTIFDAKGDLIVATAADTPARLAVGSANQTLLADSAQSTGIKWGSSPQSLMTTTGDLLYASSANTPARLGIGSTNQVLTVSGGVPAWTTPSSGSFTKITSNTFTNVSSVVIDNIFSSTYKSYCIQLLNIYGSDASYALRMRFVYSGSSETGTTYYGSSLRSIPSSSTTTYTGFNGTTFATLADYIGVTGSNSWNNGTMFVYQAGTASTSPSFTGQMMNNSQGFRYDFAGYNFQARSYTGIELYASTGNIWGNVKVYGLEA